MTSPKTRSPKTAPALTAFQYSRIYAEGWNMARKLPGGDAKNPYQTEAERVRWADGFAAALAKS